MKKTKTPSLFKHLISLSPIWFESYIFLIVIAYINSISIWIQDWIKINIAQIKSHYKIVLVSISKTK